ncbi:MAG: DUF3696 domain-containing protein [Actinomycetes bacterium]
MQVKSASNSGASEQLIRHLVVGGLKSYADPPTRVPLAPLTLVFGPNSAGKSSLLSTLTLLRQTAVSERPFELRTRGDLVDVGSFRLAVHKHDPDARITLGLGFTAPDPQLPSLISADTVRELCFGYSWDRVAERPGSTTFSIGLDGFTASFEVDADGRYVHADEDPAWLDFLASLALARQVLPPLSPLMTQPVVRSGDDEDPAGRLAQGDPVAAIRLGLSVQLYSELSEVLSRIAYIGPIRSKPDRTSALSTTAYHYVGPDGEHTTEVLADNPDLVLRVNDWFERLGIGYQIRIVLPASDEVAVTAGDFAVLGLIDTREATPSLVSSRAVGYGISQITPIVTQALASENGMLLIEQPEVHIHPKLQAAVGDLLIHSVLDRGNQVLVETHSEHLVLRLLRRIREGVIDPQDVAILYVDQLADGAAHVRQLDVDSSGELVEGWPGGFFDERLEEVLGRRW